MLIGIYFGVGAFIYIVLQLMMVFKPDLMFKVINVGESRDSIGYIFISQVLILLVSIGYLHIIGVALMIGFGMLVHKLLKITLHTHD